MANLKIHGGTRSDKSLCESCTQAWVRKGSALGEEVIMCSENYNTPIQITYPIVECSEYYNKSLPSLRAMTDIAYFINSDKRTGKIGFTSADKMKDEDKDEIYIKNPFQNRKRE